MNISELEPQKIWHYFSAICSIPHSSGNEQQLVAYILELCAKKGVESSKDTAGNLLFSLNATRGFENTPGVILQAHLDMVPQCDSCIEHDFKTDPIKPVHDGEWVRAEKTTLGADNGIGVAAILALIDYSEPHGPISAILTIEEETRLTGASQLDLSCINQNTLINLDSENFDEVFIACAGGCETIFTISLRFEPLASDAWDCFELSVSGLEGGHSGVDIHLGRGNANIIVAKLLLLLMEKHSIRLIALNGGSLANAIPREGTVHFAIKREGSADIADEVQTLKGKISALYKSDPDLEIKIANCATANCAISPELSSVILTGLAECPNGVLAMSNSLEGVVETSSSLGVVKTDAETISFITMQRSLVESEMFALREKIVSFMENAGFKSSFGDSFPPWEPAQGSSRILETYLHTYRDLFNVEPKIVAIHAGLECGVIGRLKPGIDMISFGPTIKFPHSPKEKVNIKSVQKFWKLLTQILANIAE